MNGKWKSVDALTDKSLRCPKLTSKLSAAKVSRHFIKRCQNTQPDLYYSVDFDHLSDKFVSKSNVDLSIATDIPQLVKHLQSPDPKIETTSAACLQHISFKNNDAKEDIRRAGGVYRLINLLNSEEPSVLMAATGALRNLTSGNSEQICKEFDNAGGIRAIAWLIETHRYMLHLKPGQSVLHGNIINITLENSSAILCNLSTLACMRKSVLLGAVIPTLVDTVLEDVATAAFNSLDEDVIAVSDDLPLYSSLIFRNISAIIRNISCSRNTEYRSVLRNSPGLLTSLLTVMRVAGCDGLLDTKSVENCVCAVRNLCFALPEVTDPAYLARKEPTRGRPSEIKGGNSERVSVRTQSVGDSSKSKSSKSRSRSKIVGKRKKNSPTESVCDENPLGLVVAVLWHPNSISIFISILRQASNPVVIEAAAGALQNLTASNWCPSSLVRAEVRHQNGLPVLVELLHAPVSQVVVTVSATLRNLAVDDETLLLLGRHALPVIVTSLPILSTSYDAKRQSIGGEYLTLGRAGVPSTAPLLILCQTLVSGQPEFARHFVELGGVDLCKHIAAGLDTMNEPAGCRASESDAAIAALQLLKILWKIKSLHPIYKEHGWVESDFDFKLRKEGDSLPKRCPKRYCYPVSLARKYANRQWIRGRNSKLESNSININCSPSTTVIFQRLYPTDEVTNAWEELQHQPSSEEPSNPYSVKSSESPKLRRNFHRSLSVPYISNRPNSKAIINTESMVNEEDFESIVKVKEWQSKRPLSNSNLELSEVIIESNSQQIRLDQPLTTSDARRRPCQRNNRKFMAFSREPVPVLPPRLPPKPRSKSRNSTLTQRLLKVKNTQV